MEDSVRSAYDAQRDFSNKSFRSGCYAPFVSLYFNSFGDVLACCKNETFVLGNVAQQHLDEIWNGGKVKILRESLASYRFETGCQVCEWQITGGNHKSALTALFEEFSVESMEPKWPGVIEFAGSNTCNFECIMCDGELSSSIRAHRDGLSPLPKAYGEQFFDDLRKFLPHLRRAKFLGGEPFLAQECFRIWDMMIADGLSIPCHVTTNASHYNAKVERVLEALPISLSISIDGATKETVEKVRVNANYEQLIENLHRFLGYARRRGTYLGLTYCLMRQNWHELSDFLLFAENLGCEVFVNTVISPSHCSLYTLPPEALASIADEMEKQSSSLEVTLHLNWRVWQESVQKVRNNADEGQANKLVKVLKIYDNGSEEDRVAMATRWLGEGRFDEALEEAMKAPKGHPNYYFAVVLCGQIRHLLGDLEGAERDLDLAVRISQKRPEAFIKRARLRADQKRFEEAVEDALRARDLIPKGDKLETDAREVLESLYSRRGKS